MAIAILPAIAILENQRHGAEKSVQPYTLKGRVVDAQTGAALAGVHVFVVEGEEEGFSNDKGEFKLTTWSAPPVLLVAKSSHYQTKKLTVKDSRKPLEIRLQVK